MKSLLLMLHHVFQKSKIAESLQKSLFLFLLHYNKTKLQ